MSRGADISCKVYIGDLPNDVHEQEIEKEFSYYGRLKSTWVARNPPGFAFVEYEDARDADDAIHGLDGHRVFGTRLRVELCSGKRRPKPWERDSRGPPSRHDDFRRGPSGPPRKAFDPNDECYRCGETGHYAYDCRSSGSKRRSRSKSRGRNRSRSQSKGRRSPSPRRDGGRSRDVGRNRDYGRSRDGGRSRSRSRSASRGRYGRDSPDKRSRSMD